jgi:hypothetical protein
MEVIQFNWSIIKHTWSVSINPQLQKLFDKYSNVFKETLGTMKSFQAKLQVKENARLKFLQAKTSAVCQ